MQSNYRLLMIVYKHKSLDCLYAIENHLLILMMYTTHGFAKLQTYLFL